MDQVQVCSFLLWLGRRSIELEGVNAWEHHWHHGRLHWLSSVHTWHLWHSHHIHWHHREPMHSWHAHELLLVRVCSSCVASGTGLLIDKLLLEGHLLGKHVLILLIEMLSHGHLLVDQLLLLHDHLLRHLNLVAIFINSHVHLGHHRQHTWESSHYGHLKLILSW